MLDRLARSRLSCWYGLSVWRSGRHAASMVLAARISSLPWNIWPKVRVGCALTNARTRLQPESSGGSRSQTTPKQASRSVWSFMSSSALTERARPSDLPDGTSSESMAVSASPTRTGTRPRKATKLPLAASHGSFGVLPARVERMK